MQAKVLPRVVDLERWTVPALQTPDVPGIVAQLDLLHPTVELENDQRPNTEE
jgi:hypothetical protein